MGKMGKYALYAFIATIVEESLHVTPMEIMGERKRIGNGFRKRRSSKGGNRILNDHRKKGRQKIIP